MCSTSLASREQANTTCGYGSGFGGGTRRRCSVTSADGRTHTEEGDGYRLVRRFRLWFDDHSPNQYTLFRNVAELDTYFADDLRRNPIPVRLDMVRALKANSGALGLGLWLGYRSHTLAVANRHQISVEVFGQGGLLEQLGCETAHERLARQLLRRWMAKIRGHWPNCPHELAPDGNSFVVRAERGRRMELPAELRRSVVPWTEATSPFEMPARKERGLLEEREPVGNPVK